MLEQSDVQVAEERNSRKEPFSQEEVRALLDRVSTVWIAKGRKVRDLVAGECTPDDLRGPTGNFRAPILRVGERLLVGFHPDTLHLLVGV